MKAWLKYIADPRLQESFKADLKKKWETVKRRHWLQWISFFLRNTLNSRTRKIHRKKRYGKVWKIMWLSALLPKIKTRWPSLRDPGISTTPIFEDLGVCSRHMCPVTASRNDHFVGQRPHDCQHNHLHLSRSIDRRCRLDWAHAELNAMIIFCATACERGAVKASDNGWCTSHILALLRGSLLGENG